MIKTEIVISSNKLGFIQDLLEEIGIEEYNVINIMSYKSGEGKIRKYRGAQYSQQIISKIKIEFINDIEIDKNYINRIKEETNNEAGIVLIPVNIE